MIDPSRLGLPSPEPVKIGGSATYGATKGWWCVVTGGLVAMRAVDGVQPLRRALAHAYRWVSPLPRAPRPVAAAKVGSRTRKNVAEAL